MDEHTKAIEAIVRELSKKGVYAVGIDLSWAKDEKGRMNPTATIRAKICTDPAI